MKTIIRILLIMMTAAIFLFSCKSNHSAEKTQTSTLENELSVHGSKTVTKDGTLINIWDNGVANVQETNSVWKNFTPQKSFIINESSPAELEIDTRKADYYMLDDNVKVTKKKNILHIVPKETFSRTNYILVHDSDYTLYELIYAK